MSSEEIYKILLNGERVTLECKKAKDTVPNSIWETYSAFANTYGGIILMGVSENLLEKDSAKRFTITGVENAKKIRTDLWNMLNNPEKVNVNLLIDGDIEIVSIEGKDIIIIRVPAARYQLRPIYINNNPLRGTYRRNHEGDYHMPEHGVRMMLRDANEEGNDHLLIEYYTMDDIDKPSLERYRQEFNSDHPDHPWKPFSDIEFLKELGGYTVDRRTGKEGLTLAGLLMFGKGLPIRERFSNLRMDYIDKSRLVGDQRYSDRITYDGTWENNLYNFIRMVIPRLTDVLPRPFQMEGIIRKDDTKQHKAVREAIANSIIHSDFMLNGLLRIIKYDDRFEITNPGLLKLPVDQIYDGGETKARNQSLQIMLRMLGFGENIGSGFPLILQAWEQMHWSRPELIEQPELMQTKLTLPINISKQEVSYIPSEEKTSNTQNTIDEDDVAKHINERQNKILQLLKENPNQTWQKLAISMNVSPKTVQRDLDKLRDLNIISRKGSRTNGYWEILIK